MAKLVSFDGVNTPWHADRFPAYAYSMKTIPNKKALTLGQFIMTVYDIIGKRKARGIVQRAVNAQVVEFLGERHFLIS